MYNVPVSIYVKSVLRKAGARARCGRAENAGKTLTALENDDYKVLPEATFIKGYYRSYAKYLNADASIIIQRFDEIYANDTGLLPNHALTNSPIKIMGKLPGSNSERNRKWLKRSVLIVLVLVILGLIFTAIQNWSSKKNDATAPAASNVEILPMGNASAASGDQLVLNFTRQPLFIL